MYDTLQVLIHCRPTGLTYMMYTRSRPVLRHHATPCIDPSLVPKLSHSLLLELQREGFRQLGFRIAERLGLGFREPGDEASIDLYSHDTRLRPVYSRPQDPCLCSEHHYQNNQRSSVYNNNDPIAMKMKCQSVIVL